MKERIWMAPVKDEETGEVVLYLGGHQKIAAPFRTREQARKGAKIANEDAKKEGIKVRVVQPRTSL